MSCSIHNRRIVLAAAMLALFAWMAPMGIARARLTPVSHVSWDFQGGSGRWRFIACQGEVVPEPARRANQTMQLMVDLPTPAAMTIDVNLDAQHLGRIAYRVYVPPNAPWEIKPLFYLKDKDGLWFQTLREEPLEPGKWSEHVVDVSPDSVELQPRGHFRRWNAYLSHKMNLIGIKFISSEPYKGPVYVDDIRAYRATTRAERLRILNFTVNAAQVKRFDKFEVTLQLNRPFRNPFDPNEIDLQGHFTTPSGKVQSIPGFYYQQYLSALEGDDEKLTPVDMSCWKLRFAPAEVGTHQFEITVKAGSDELRTAKRSFVSTPSDDPGYLRISKQDYRCWEFDNGQFFYPIGHNLRSPNDSRCADMLSRALGTKIPTPPDRGTYAYQDIFPKMAANGENFAEVWMASWWVDIEWTKAWKDYQGLGDYNLANAWKLDRVLELARQNGIYVHLVIDNHGKISEWCDPEWKDSPYNVANGGILRDPEHFFTDRHAMEIYKRKLRYIVGRWGYETIISGFELWSELDLVGNDTNKQNFMRHPSQTTWHREMTEYLKALDPWKHILTTHYSTNYTRIDPNVVSLPNIDYVAVDAYRQGEDMRCVAELMKEASVYCRQWRKPHFITEYGGAPFGPLLNDVASLESDLHAGIWSGYMLPMVGTPLLWWFDYIDRDDVPMTPGPKYFHYNGLAKYAAGEDRRDPMLNVGTVALSAANVPSQPRGMCLQSDTRAYCWIYDESCMIRMKSDANALTYKGVTATINGLKPGKYSVELWDTFRGLATSRTTADVAGSALSFPLPDFARDIAVKVKKIQNSEFRIQN